MNLADVTRHVQNRLREHVPGSANIDVSPPTLLSAGWESDIYQFDYAVNGGEVAQATRGEGALPLAPTGELVARLYFGDNVAEKARREFGVLERLAAIGYPCPAPLWLDAADSAWGNDVLVMTRVAGVQLWPLLFESDAETQDWARATFVAQMLALHALDAEGLGLGAILGAPAPGEAVSRQLQKTKGLLATLPDAGFEDVWPWLAAWSERIGPGRVGLAHWDLHPANVLVTMDTDVAQRQVHVIDWSGAEITDTRFDLAWTLVVIGTQSGWDAADAIRRGYETGYANSAGIQADMDFFVAFACARRLFVITVALTHGTAALGLRPGAEEAIRKGLHAVRSLYARWLDLAGSRLPVLEEILEQ